MNQILDCPVLGLTTEFPDQLFVLRHPPTGKYGCYSHEGIHGLASFTDEAGAYRFSEHIGLNGLICEAVSFDEAREIAKQRPLPIVSLMLLDDLRTPKIHYVR
ncbi:MAG: hypothetical protein MUC92_11465 [Fimbriimonadaceae bacterium]|jgi:hypothetical protein|nr:hypothetical protein [Fimbriimonadaceae bacterium]